MSGFACIIDVLNATIGGRVCAVDPVPDPALTRRDAHLDRHAVLSGPGEAEAAPALPAGWTTPVNISNEGGNSEAPTIVVDDNGRVYATWTEWYGGVGAPRGMMFNSTNAAGQWGTTTGAGLFYPNIDDVGFPVVVCHPTNGHAYQLYHDGDLANANMEILVREYVNNTEVDAAWMSLTPNSSSYVTAAVNPLDSSVYAVWMDDISGTDHFELAMKRRDPATGEWDAGRCPPDRDRKRKILAPHQLRRQGYGPSPVHHPPAGDRLLHEEPHAPEPQHLDGAGRSLA